VCFFSGNSAFSSSVVPASHCLSSPVTPASLFHPALGQQHLVLSGPGWRLWKPLGHSLLSLVAWTCVHASVHTSMHPTENAQLWPLLTIFGEPEPMPCVQVQSQGLPSAPDAPWGICRMFFGIGTYCFHRG
jgi:hypothetical protein